MHVWKTESDGILERRVSYGKAFKVRMLTSASPES
jgi:hypothetical protein